MYSGLVLGPPSVVCLRDIAFFVVVLRTATFRNLLLFHLKFPGCRPNPWTRLTFLGTVEDEDHSLPMRVLIFELK